MRQTKLEMRKNWLIAHIDEIVLVTDHSACKGYCKNGRTCKCQSGGGYGYWSKAFAAAGIDCQPMRYWSGPAPTPSTSINVGCVAVLFNHRRELIEIGIY
jgi:hypothetical protein